MELLLTSSISNSKGIKFRRKHYFSKKFRASGENPSKPVLNKNQHLTHSHSGSYLERAFELHHSLPKVAMEQICTLNPCYYFWESVFCSKYYQNKHLHLCIKRLGNLARGKGKTKDFWTIYPNFPH